jgi:hypothetical protein
MTTPTLLKPLNSGALLRLFRGVLLVAPWIVWLFLSDVALLLLLPVSLVAPNTAYHLSSKIAYLVGRWLQEIFTNANGARITVSGTHLP